MAKAAKKQPAERKPGQIPEDNMSVDMFDTVLAGAIGHVATNRRRFGADEAEFRQISIPLPSLCLQYLLSQTGWPLGRTMLLAGPPGACKTSLLDEVMRWHLLCNGRSLFVDAERKDSPQRRNSILLEPSLISRCDVEEVATTESWQKAVTNQLDQWRTAMIGTDKVAGVGLRVPLFIGVDSIAAVTTEGETANVEDGGSAGRGQFGAAALIASNYLKSYAHLSDDMPSTLVLISHQKGEEDPTKTTVVGGKAPQFHCSYYVEMRRTKFIHTATYGGVSVKIHTKKNSLGEGDRTILANFIWTMAKDPETGLPVQTSYWDWPTATVRMLEAERQKSAGARDSIDEILDMRTKGEAQHQRYYSTALGMTEKTAVPCHEFGKMIDANQAVCRDLMVVLKIHPRPYFVVGTDYRRQQDIAVREGRSALRDGRQIHAAPSCVADVTEKIEEAARSPGRGSAKTNMLDSMPVKTTTTTKKPAAVTDPLLSRVQLPQAAKGVDKPDTKPAAPSKIGQPRSNGQRPAQPTATPRRLRQS